MCVSLFSSVFFEEAFIEKKRRTWMKGYRFVLFRILFIILVESNNRSIRLLLLEMRKLLAASLHRSFSFSTLIVSFIVFAVLNTRISRIKNTWCMNVKREHLSRMRDFKSEYSNCHAYCARPKVEFEMFLWIFFWLSKRKRNKPMRREKKKQNERKCKRARKSRSRGQES